MKLAINYGITVFIKGRLANTAHGCIWLYCIVISTGYTSSGVSTNCVFSDMISGLYGSGS
jgi:hypothetical protein